MKFDERLKEIRARMRDAGFDRVIALHDGAHFIEKPNPVTVLTGLKSLGPSAAILDKDGEVTLLVIEADTERARERCPNATVVASDDLVAGVRENLGPGSIGLAGVTALPWRLAKPLLDAFPNAKQDDGIVMHPARRKTDEELANAREATRIAEAGYGRLLEIARPGISEDDLAAELRWHSRTLGAEDNFTLMSAGPHNKAVAPSNGRKLRHGDVIVVELTPSYRGQLVQICRTVSIGEASAALRDKYALVVRSMEAGIAAARPGGTMAGICRAINEVLEAEGYAEYCHPPHIRRRGHGLGFTAMGPGDVALENPTVLEPDMLFMVHPNQYIPEVGYLLCGEPVVVRERGPAVLTQKRATLAEIAV